MRWLAGLLVLAVAAPTIAYADAPPAPPPAPPTAPPPGAAAPASPAPQPGLAVLAVPGAEAVARGLAQEVYGRSVLRPPSLDERRAQAIMGGPRSGDTPPEVLEIGDERAGVHGDDAASRALLRTLAGQLGVRTILVVEKSDAGEPSARVYLADTNAFDAARYAPDPAPLLPSALTLPPATLDAGAPAAASDGGMAATGPSWGAPPTSTPPAAPTTWKWSGTVASLERAYGNTPPADVVHAPTLATTAVPEEKPKAPESHPFYTSPWFWGAVGAAAFGGTAVYFATRDNSTGTIHLEMQVPK